jgi:hypothetical protein
VLFDWLMTADPDAVPIAHPAEKQALMDLLSRPEETEVARVTEEDVGRSRAKVSKDMGW